MSFYLHRLFKEPIKKNNKKQQTTNKKRYKQTKIIKIIEPIKKNIVCFVIEFEDD